MTGTTTREGRGRILLVDDETILLLSLRQELRNELGPGYRVDMALAAEEGLAILDEARDEGDEVGLVISDWLMPGMKGDEFIMRARERQPSLRTIMVSGQTDASSLGTLSRSGALDVFIRKPWGRDDLVAACRRLLRPA